MKFIQDIIFGFQMHWKSLRFIFLNHLYFFIIIPMALMMMLYGIGQLILNRKIDVQTASVNEIIWLFVDLVLEIGISVIFMEFAKYVVVIVLSPLLAYISQKCEYIQTKKSYKYNFTQLKKDVARSIKLSLRNMLLKYLFFITLFVISYLFWEKPESSPILFLTYIVGAYFYGFSFLDYTNERHLLSINESILKIRQNFGFAIVIGSVFTLLIFAPINLAYIFNLNLSEGNHWHALLILLKNVVLLGLASFAPIWAIVTATLGILEINKRKF
jgi:CysZ protein